MKSEVSHNIATVLMSISLLTAIIAVFSLLETDEYDPDEDVCVLWDRGSSSYTYDDECIQYQEGGQKVAIEAVVIGSVTFSSSLLLFLYSISKFQKKEVDETESTSKAEHAIILRLEEIIGLLRNDNSNIEEGSNTIHQRMIELDKESQYSIEETIECGACGNPVQDTDISCTSCGAEFEVQDNPISTPKCEGCYISIEDEDSIFCDDCFAAMNERETREKIAIAKRLLREKQTIDEESE